MNGIFGWSYPAGAANDPNAPYNQEEIPDNWLLSEAFPDHDSIGELYRTTYKYTSCGPAIGALITYIREPTVEGFDQWDGPDEITEWFYCSDLYKFGTWAEMNEQGARVDAIKVSSIVEGVDEGTETIEIPCEHFDMEPEELRKQYWDAVEATNAEAHSIWNETHGCEDCFPDTGEYELTPINPDCKTCGGQGTII